MPVDAGRSGRLSVIAASSTTVIEKARGRSAYASSEESATYAAGQAVDGFAATRWASKYYGVGAQDIAGDPALWWVDLDANDRTVSRVIITWQTNAIGVDYKIQTSVDGTAWADKATVTANASAGPLTYNFSGVACRYVRVRVTKRDAASAAGGWGVSAYEITVWGPDNDGYVPRTPTPVPDPTPVPTPSGWVPYFSTDFSNPSDLALGTAPNGQKSGSGGTWWASNVAVVNGELQIRSNGAGSNGAWKLFNYSQTYGRFETRVRMDYGGGAKPCILWWPNSDRWPVDGEIDFYETFGTNYKVDATNHWDARNFGLYGRTSINPTAWVDVVCEWKPNSISVWHNGVLRMRAGQPSVVGTFYNGGTSSPGTPGWDIPNKPMHIGFQIDGDGTAAGSWETGRQPDAPAWQIFHIDYVRLYKPA